VLRYGILIESPEMSADRTFLRTMSERNSDTNEDVTKLSRRDFMAAGSALAGTTALANLSEVSEAANFSSPVDFKGAYVGPDSDKTGLGAKGWLYFADDSGTVYKHDGSGWVDLGIGGSSVWEDADGDGVYSLKDGSGISTDEQSINPADFTGFPYDTPLLIGTEYGRAMDVLTADSTGYQRASATWWNWDYEEQIFVIDGGAIPDDDQFSLYTRDAPLGDGGSPLKRLDVDAGAQDVRARWQNLDRMLVEGGNGPDLFLRSTEQNQVASLRYSAPDGSGGYTERYDFADKPEFDQFEIKCPQGLLVRANDNGRLDFMGPNGQPIRVPRLSSDPSSPTDGTLWYNTNANEYRGSEGGSVVSFDTTVV
jgi:hypothetical protein